MRPTYLHAERMHFAQPDALADVGGFHCWSDSSWMVAVRAVNNGVSAQEQDLFICAALEQAQSWQPISLAEELADRARQSQFAQWQCAANVLQHHADTSPSGFECIELEDGLHLHLRAQDLLSNRERDGNQESTMELGSQVTQALYGSNDQCLWELNQPLRSIPCVVLPQIPTVCQPKPSLRITLAEADGLWA